MSSHPDSSTIPAQPVDLSLILAHERFGDASTPATELLRVLSHRDVDSAVVWLDEHLAGLDWMGGRAPFEALGDPSADLHRLKHEAKRRPEALQFVLPWS